MIENSRNTKKFEVVFLEKNLRDEENPEDRVLKVKNHKSLYETNIKPSINGIAVCRQVRFQRCRHPEFSNSMTDKTLKR